MEPLTHTLVGAALARTGLGGRTALGAASLVIGANLPDIDAFCYAFAARDTALHLRRGVTHGLLAMAVLPLLLAAALLLWDRWVRLPRAAGRADPPVPAAFLELAALSYLAVFTHPFLDWLNNYGMRWLMPFDGRWTHGDTLFIGDPWIWLLLGGALFLGGAGRASVLRWTALALVLSLLVFGQTSRGPAPPTARLLWSGALVALALLRLTGPLGRAGRERAALLGLAGTGLYIAVLLGLAHGGRHVALKALVGEHGLRVSELMVAPVAANPTVWEVVARTDGGHWVGRLHWRSGPRLEPLLELRDGGPAEVIAAARSAPWVRGMVDWARFPHYEVETLTDGYRVHILDARYARTRRRGFGAAVVRLDRQLRPVPEGP